MSLFQQSHRTSCFRDLTEEELATFAEEEWTEHHTPPEDDEKHSEFIARNKLQITLELFESAKKFQIIMRRAVRDWINHKKHFNLKLNIIQNVHTFKLVAHYEDESHKYCVRQPNGTYICQCTFIPSLSRETTDITKIMRSDVERLDWGLLNNNANSHLNYSVIKTKNKPRKKKEDVAFWNEYKDHLEKCKWMAIDDTLLLFLYQAQIESVHIFLNRIKRRNDNPSELLSPMDVDDLSQSSNRMDIDIQCPSERQIASESQITTESTDGDENRRNHNQISVQSQTTRIPMESKQTDTVDFTSLSPEGKVRAIVSPYGWSEITAKNMLSFKKCCQRMNVWMKKRERVTMRVQPLDKTNPEWKPRRNITIGMFGDLIVELEGHLTEDDVKQNESYLPHKKRRLIESTIDVERPKCPSHIMNAVLNINQRSSEPKALEHQNGGEKEEKMTVIQSVIYHKSAEQCLDRLVSKQTMNHQQDLNKDLKQWVQSLFHDAKFPPNESQCDAICKSMLFPLSLIHGPPGTGKTATSANLVCAILQLQAQQRQQDSNSDEGKILVCGYTHAAVNQLSRKIASSSIANPKGCPTQCDEHCEHLDFLRLGDVDRCPADLKPFCLQKKIEIATNGKDVKGTVDLATYEKIVDRIYRNAKVVIGTAYSLAWLIGSYRYDWLLIDECTQILDPILNIAVNAMDLHSNPHLIMIGDHKQLPPVIISDKLKRGYQSLFEILATTAEKAIDSVDMNQCGFYTMLDTQYRMPEILMRFSNSEFYGNRIKSQQLGLSKHPIYQQIERIMDGIEKSNDRSIDVFHREDVPLSIVLMNDAVAEVADNAGNISKMNEQEVRLIIDRILPHFDSSVSVGVISLYKPQAQRIKELVSNLRLNEKRNIMTSTVDAFQGMEKDVIILSLVTDVTRNTRFGNKEFNKDPNRMNVALTRCSKALIVVTSANLKSSDQNVWTRFFDQSMRLLTECK